MIDRLLKLFHLQRIPQTAAQPPAPVEPLRKPVTQTAVQQPVTPEPRAHIKIETQVHFVDGRAVCRKVPVNELQEFPDA